MQLILVDPLSKGARRWPFPDREDPERLRYPGPPLERKPSKDFRKSSTRVWVGLRLYINPDSLRQCDRL